MIRESEAEHLSSEMKESLSDISKATKSLEKLIAGLLEVARSEVGVMRIGVRPIDVSVTIHEVFEELRVLADKKSIQLIYKPQPDLPKILADSDRLKEAIKNLVNNAIKYTIGARTVTISHELKEKTLVTHVQDSGVGISKEDQKRLFKKFYRIKQKGTEHVLGIGLGLWIVKQFIEDMNGEIWVESEEGRGSTFSFQLPIVFADK